MIEFFHMGGYAFFVWSSFALTFAVLAMNIWMAARRRKQAIRNLKRRLLLEDDEPQA